MALRRSTALDRRLDRYVGIPVVTLVGTVRRRRSLPQAPRRIGLIQPTAIGDLILGTGLLVHLGKRFPDAEFHLFLGPGNAPLVPLLPVPVQAHLCNFKIPWHAWRALRRTRLDIIVDLTPWPRLTALCAALSGAFAVGFQSPQQFRHYAFDIAVPYARDVHVTENFRHMAEYFGRCDDYRLAIKAGASAPPGDLAFERLILCHPAPGGTQAQAKSWPVRHWAELARRLAARGYLLGFTGLGRDAATINDILGHAALPTRQAFSLCDRLDLGGLAAVLQRACLLISVDTGVLHLASALERPVIGLHGPTKAARWGARGPHAVGLDAPHPGGGYITFGYEDAPEGARIMASLTVEAVERAALGLLREE